MGLALVNGMLCDLVHVSAGLSPEEDLHNLLAAIRASIDPPQFADGQQCRNVIADVRSTGLPEGTVRASLAAIRSITAGRVDWLRVIGVGFDLTFRG